MQKIIAFDIDNLDPHFFLQRGRRIGAKVPFSGMDDLHEIGMARLASMNERLQTYRASTAPNVHFLNGASLLQLGKTVSGLQPDIEKSDTLTPGTYDVRSTENTLVSALRSKYQNALHTMMNLVIQDCYMDVACLRFAKYLNRTDGPSSEHVPGMHAVPVHGVQMSTNPPLRSSTTRVEHCTPKELDLIKLLISDFWKDPSYGTVQFGEAVALCSSSTVHPEDPLKAAFAAETHQVWETLRRICGKTEKLGGTSKDLKTVVYNSIRSLEVACEHHVASSIQIRQTYLPQHRLDQIRDFSNFSGDPVYPSSMEHVWQMVYWVFRIGDVEAIKEIPLWIDKSSFADVAESILEPLCAALANRLLQTTWSPECCADSVDDRQPISQPRTTRHNQEKLLDALRTITVDAPPMLALLLSFLDPERSVVNIRNVIVSASAEDVLWFKLHMAVLLADDDETLPERIIKIQEQVLRAGPERFDQIVDTTLMYSDGWDKRSVKMDVNLNFGRLLLITLRFGDAIGWIADTYPSLQRVCLHWALYAHRLGLIGEPPYESKEQDPLLTHYLETPFGVDSISIGTVLSTLLQDHSLPVKLDYLPCLRGTDSIRVISKLIWHHMDELMSSSLLGSVTTDGRKTPGELQRRLAEHLGPDLASEVASSVAIVVARNASEMGKYDQALDLYFMCNRDEALVDVLMQAYNTSDIFPYEGPFPHDKRDLRNKILRYSQFITSRYATDFSNDSLQHLESMRLLAACYDMTREEEYAKAAVAFRNTGLIPATHTVDKLLATPLKPQVSKILAAYAACLFGQSRNTTDTTSLTNEMLSLFSALNVVADHVDDEFTNSARQALRQLLD